MVVSLLLAPTNASTDAHEIVLHFLRNYYVVYFPKNEDVGIERGWGSKEQRNGEGEKSSSNSSLLT